MKVYALTGKSGTGKSYQATNLCREMNIEAIIDDGLLIFGNSIVAGVSAKRQDTMIGATKTALFSDPEHRRSVIEGIKRTKPESILVLGTSDKMARLICEALELPEISRIIHIEDITTEKERAEAGKQRRELGKHVIPAPAFELKRDFSGYLLDPLKIFRTWGRGKGRGFSEKSVVRPTYSYRGDYTISDKVIRDIVTNVAAGTEQVREILRVDAVKKKEGITVKVSVIMKQGCNLYDVAGKVQKQLYEKVEYMTAFNVIDLDIDIRGLA